MSGIDFSQLFIPLEPSPLQPFPLQHFSLKLRKGYRPRQPSPLQSSAALEDLEDLSDT
jgi:hypothetical protein